MFESKTDKSAEELASELVEKFKLGKDKAGKLAEALPELCQEFLKETSSDQPLPLEEELEEIPPQAPIDPRLAAQGQPQQPGQFPELPPVESLDPQTLIQMRAFIEQLNQLEEAEGLAGLEGSGDSSKVPQLFLEDVFKVLEDDILKDLKTMPLESVVDSINIALDVLEIEEEDPESDLPDQIFKRIAPRGLEEIVQKLLTAFRGMRQPVQQPAATTPQPPTKVEEELPATPDPWWRQGFGRVAAQAVTPPVVPATRLAGRLGTGLLQRFRRFPWISSADARDFKPLYMDSIDLTMDEISVGDDGVLTGNCVATAAMVQDYDGKKVLKDPGELALAVNYARQIPIAHDHPEDGIITEQSQIKGWTTPVAYDTENQRISCGVEIGDADLVKVIEGGKTDVSIGFFCDLDEKEGEFNGEKYTAVQRNIVLNHLAAGIDNGRCPGGVCGIGQDATKPPAEVDLQPDPVVEVEEPAKEEDEEDISLEVHEKLLKEKTEALNALSQKLTESAEAMDPETLRAISSQMEDIVWEIRKTAAVVQAKKEGTAETEDLLKDAHKEISNIVHLMSDVLTVPLIEAKCVLKDNLNHTHTVELDDDGNGVSDEVNAHSHKIIGKTVMFENYHTHDLEMVDEEEEEGDPVDTPEANPPGEDEYEEEDAKLTAAQRKALPDEVFCGPDRSFPVNDCAHYTAAKRLLGRYKGPGDKTEILDCIEARGKLLKCPTAIAKKEDEEEEEDTDEPVEDFPPKTEAERAMTHFKISQKKWDGLTEEEKAEFIKNLPARGTAEGPEPAAAPDEEDTATIPGQSPVPEKKTDAEKALDLKRRETIDAIMDFNPPEPREAYEKLDLDMLDRTLALLKSQETVDLIHRSGSKVTDTRQRIDDAYKDLEKKKSGK